MPYEIDYMKNTIKFRKKIVIVVFHIINLKGLELLVRVFLWCQPNMTIPLGALAMNLNAFNFKYETCEQAYRNGISLCFFIEYIGIHAKNG